LLLCTGAVRLCATLFAASAGISAAIAAPRARGAQILDFIRATADRAV
jgi:hypothetical protein